VCAQYSIISLADQEPLTKPLYPEMADYDPKVFIELEPEAFNSTILLDQNVSFYFSAFV
jgi:hypothetical protein